MKEINEALEHAEHSAHEESCKCPHYWALYYYCDMTLSEVFNQWEHSFYWKLSCVDWKDRDSGRSLWSVILNVALAIFNNGLGTDEDV